MVDLARAGLDKGQRSVLRPEKAVSIHTAAKPAV